MIEVPLDLALDGAMLDEEERAEASLAEARALGEELGVEVVATHDAGTRDRRAIVDRRRARPAPT